jgi:hypothetical protein
MVDAVLAERGQTQLPVAGVRPRAFNNAHDVGIASPWPAPPRLEEMQSGIVPRPPERTYPYQAAQARKAPVAEPGSQTLRVSVNGVARRRPHIKLHSDDHGATASGSRATEILNEVSAGTKPMTARKAAHCMFWKINADPRKANIPGDTRIHVFTIPVRRVHPGEGQTRLLHV